MILRWRQVSFGDGPSIASSLLQEEFNELNRLAEDVEVLEIGSAFGASTISMALAGAMHVTAIDPHCEWIPTDSFAVMSENVEAYGVADRITILRDWSHNVLAEQRRLHSGKYGLIFIDGDHTARGVRADIVAIDGLLAPGGTVAFHDYGEATSGGVQQALDEVFPHGPTKLTGTLFQVEEGGAWDKRLT